SPQNLASCRVQKGRKSRTASERAPLRDFDVLMLGRSQCHAGGAYRGDLFAAKRSHSHVHRGLTGGCATLGECRINMAFRKTSNGVEHDQPAETEVEAEIREFVRRDVVTNRERQPESESEIAVSSINSVLQRATTTSVQEIDRLITELQTLSDTLHS